MGKKGKPKEWVNCPKMCSEPAFGRFVAFKTPYNSEHNSQTEETFDVSSVFELAKERGMKMGLWFDFTNVDRYYDGREVERNNCVYKKLKCSGRDMSYMNSLLKKFKKECNEFFELNLGMLVGVHCTHGFNRTGYVIVSYMVDELGWDVSAAVNEFARVRPPGIYKKDKLDDLSRKYNVVLRVPPVSPPWIKVGKQRGFKNLEKKVKTEDNNKTDGGSKSVTPRPNSTYNAKSKSRHEQGRSNEDEEPLSWRTTSSSPRYFRQPPPSHR